MFTKYWIKNLSLVFKFVSDGNQNCIEWRKRSWIWASFNLLLILILFEIKEHRQCPQEHVEQIHQLKKCTKYSRFSEIRFFIYLEESEGKDSSICFSLNWLSAREKRASVEVFDYSSAHSLEINLRIIRVLCFCINIRF